MQTLPWTGLQHEDTEQTEPAGQAGSPGLHVLKPVHRLAAQSTHSQPPASEVVQKHVGLLPQIGAPHAQPGPGVQAGVAANAGVLMLVSTGAVQAMAMPAPTRFSIFRREIPASDDSANGFSSFI
jgi:hypothetical protein